jgi:DNA-binding SARP family transcriptional activator/tetratricopeptide (TPR) repeat protein
MTGIELFLLGGFEGRGPGGAPIVIAPRKARALLAYLGFQLGKAVPREHLSSLIWGDISADEQARRSLRQALTTLRRELPEGALETRRDEIMLCAGASVDVSRFEHEARQTERSPLERALELYRGELLEGLSARASGFDAWLERERKRLHMLAADAMQRLCEIQRAQGDAAASMATAMRLVATDPVREAAHRLLMELYVEDGRASEAVRQFNTLRALLHEKLGTLPDAQTTDLLERIRRSSERRKPQDAPSSFTTPSPRSTASERFVLAGAPELRQACVLAIAPGERGFDASVERDIEIVLARFGGSLMQVAQQRALGVFGFPRAHDNDLERGVRAALELCRLESLAPKAAIGVASGPLWVEYGAERPVFRGEVLARASELLSLDGDGVRVTGSVASALGERLEARLAGPELDARWVTRCFGAVELPCRTPLVGRRYELAQLTGGLELCLASGRGRTFIVRGEAGIGKSRLLRAACDVAFERGFCVHARAIVDFGDDGREQPIQGIVRELLSDDESSEPGPRPASSLRAIDDAELSLLLELVREVPRKASVQEIGGRELYLRARRSAASKLLALRSASRPRLIWIDDIHWADAETLAQIALWSELAANHPLLLMVTTRGEAEPAAGAARSLGRGSPVTTLDLAPLTPDEARELAFALEPGDERGAELVLARAGGNPLFIEQLLRFPHDRRVPAGISSLVQARTDQLEPEDRSLLQAAAVLGHHFTLPALSHLVEQNEPSLGTLNAQSLITERGDGYAFVHALVRAAVYDGLEPERRVRLHASAARYYAGRDAALHAEHLDRAGDESAATAYVAAATSERRAGNTERALALCQRARELAQRTQDRFTSALLLGEISIDVGRSEAALEAFAAALASASDAADRVRGHLGRAAALRVLDRSKEALLELAAAERQLDPQREPLLQSRIHYLRGNVMFPLGDWAACFESQKLALEAARRTGSTLAEAQALSGMADAHFLAGRWRTARACFVRCEQAARQLGALDLELTSRGMQHLLEGYDLSLSGAAAGCREVAERARASGSLRAEAVARASAAWALLMLGDWGPALSEACRVVSVADGLGAQRFSTLGMAYSTIARARLGERAPHSELARALAQARSSTLRFSGAAVYAALLATSENDRIASLLQDADAVIGPACTNVSLIAFIPHGVTAAIKLGDVRRAAYYADLLEASMREEPHSLGALLIDFSRTLCACTSDPNAENVARELERLREQLDRAGMRPAAAHIEHFSLALLSPRLRIDRPER